MAQDPEDDEEQQEVAVDTSHDLDMVTIYTSLATDAEMEADVIRGVLESNGVPAIIIRAAQFAPLGYQVQVPRDRVDDAKRLIDEAQAAGSEAAVEAEAESEKGQ